MKYKYDIEMKIKTFTRALPIALMMLMGTTSLFAQVPASYSCSLRNDSLLTAKIYEFDIYLQNTDGANVFELAGFQAGIPVSSSIVNGGTITCLLYTSDAADE